MTLSTVVIARMDVRVGGACVPAGTKCNAWRSQSVVGHMVIRPPKAIWPGKLLVSDQAFLRAFVYVAEKSRDAA